MQLGTLLRSHDLQPTDVTVLFNVSNVPALHRALPYLAEEEPELFDAFQNQHGPNVEATLKRRRFVASFVNAHGNGYVFVGLFEVIGGRFQTMAELDADPRRVQLQHRFGDGSFVAHGQLSKQAGRTVFDLRLREEMKELIGRLTVEKPARTRNYRFLAETLDCPVLEICRTRQLAPPPPEWRDFIVTAQELASLPREWAMRLAGWRGVYLITDERDGQRYVGSAYGGENLLGRWRLHTAGDQGVTKELRDRDPASFRFSILQLLLHDAGATEVITLESNWKTRLHTRIWGLNAN